MRLLPLLPLLALPAFAIACAVQSNGEGSTESGSALSSSLGLMQTCAAAATYDMDGPNDFDVPSTSSIPAGVRSNAKFDPGSSVGHFKAPSVGDVYVVSSTDPNETYIALYDRNGTLLTYGYPASNGHQWVTANGGNLDCSSTPYNVQSYGSTSSSSSGWIEVDGGEPCGVVMYDDAGNASESTCPGATDGGMGGY